MADLSVNVAGVEFKNPIIPASGTFGFGQEYERYFDPALLGGIALKALTIEKRLGNPPVRIAEAASGMLNSVGLQNPGVDAFLEEIWPKIRRYNTVMIANIAGAVPEDYLAVIEKLNDTDMDMYELNVSCPNVAHGGVQFGTDPDSLFSITKQAAQAAKKPLIVKLTPNVTDIKEMAKAAQEGGADAISLINTLTGLAIDARTRKPILANRTGGLSGPAVKPVALRMVNEVYNTVSLPIIGMGGIMTGEDAAEFMIAGASAVMVGTATVADPYSCIRIIGELDRFLDEEEIASARELTGTLK